MTINIDKLKKDTKNKVLYRVMFTWDESNNFYVIEKNGKIKPILESFTPKVNNIVIATISNSQSTQNMAAIMPSDGYKYSYLTMNNTNRSSNNMSTTSAPLTTYTYIVPS
jgi:precorrin-6B methylase 2